MSSPDLFPGEATMPDGLLPLIPFAIAGLISLLTWPAERRAARALEWEIEHFLESK